MSSPIKQVGTLRATGQRQVVPASVPNPMLMVALVVVGLLIGAVAGCVVPQRQIGDLQRTIKDLQAKVTATQQDNARLMTENETLRKRAPAVYDYEKEIEGLQVAVEQGKFDYVREQANKLFASDDKPPSPKAVHGLWSVMIEAYLSELLATKCDDDHVARLRYEEILKLAEARRIQKRLPAAVVMERAYNHDCGELARLAFLMAWSANEIDHSSLTKISFYHAILRNFGKKLVSRNDPQGWIILRTACEISKAYGLPQHEACQDLEKFPKDKLVPLPEADDPVLAAASTKQ